MRCTSAEGPTHEAIDVRAARSIGSIWVGTVHCVRTVQMDMRNQFQMPSGEPTCNATKNNPQATDVCDAPEEKTIARLPCDGHCSNLVHYRRQIPPTENAVPMRTWNYP